jgi:hypothetical protein
MSPTWLGPKHPLQRLEKEMMLNALQLLISDPFSRIPGQFCMFWPPPAYLSIIKKAQVTRGAAAAVSKSCLTFDNDASWDGSASNGTTFLCPDISELISFRGAGRLNFECCCFTKSTWWASASLCDLSICQALRQIQDSISTDAVGFEPCVLRIGLALSAPAATWLNNLLGILQTIVISRGSRR